MGWLNLIMMIVQFILGKIQPAPASVGGHTVLANYKSPEYADTQIRKMAKLACQLEPQLRFDCVVKILPDMLDRLAEHVRANGITNVYQLIPIVVDSLATLVKCQLGTVVPQDAHAQQIFDKDLQTKILTCGISAFFAWLKDRDIGKAVSAFFSCVLSGGTPTDPNQPPVDPPVDPPPGGIDPTKPNFPADDINRC